MIRLRHGIAILALFATTAWAQDTALVMSLQGKVTRVAQPAPQAVEAFVKLKQGDVLTLDKDAKLQVVYFEGGRQETWVGAGKLEIASAESKATGLAAPQVKQLPAVMVKQLARTPSLDSQGRAGVMRLRSIPTPEAIAKVEENYKKLRAESDKADLAPEMYRLSGLFEMRELDKVEQAVADLKKEHADNLEAKLLASLYTKALKDAKAAQIK